MTFVTNHHHHHRRRKDQTIHPTSRKRGRVAAVINNNTTSDSDTSSFINDHYNSTSRTTTIPTARTTSRRRLSLTTMRQNRLNPSKSSTGPESPSSSSSVSSPSLLTSVSKTLLFQQRMKRRSTTTSSSMRLPYIVLLLVLFASNIPQHIDAAKPRPPSSEESSESPDHHEQEQDEAEDAFPNVSPLTTEELLRMYDTPDLYQYRVPCPADPTIVGYTSIEALNMELQRHARKVQPPIDWQLGGGSGGGGDRSGNSPPQRRFMEYTICPNTILNGEEQLTPLLGASKFVCGADGKSTNNCIIRGGTTQVLLIIDPTNDSYRMSSSLSISENTFSNVYEFHGITFEESTDISIAALASYNIRAQFVDCHWKKSTGSAAIFIAKAQAVALPHHTPDLTFRLNDNIFNRHDPEEISNSQDLVGNSNDKYAAGNNNNNNDNSGDNSNDDPLHHRHHVRRRLYDDVNAEYPTSQFSKYKPDDVQIIGNENLPPNVHEQRAMNVILKDCTIEDSGVTSSSPSTTSTSFRNAIYNNGGYLEMIDSKIQNNYGMFVLNVVHGGTVSLIRTIIDANPVSTAVIRAIYHSYVELNHCIIQNHSTTTSTATTIDTSSSSNNGEDIDDHRHHHNDNMLTTIAALETSDVILDSTLLQDNTPVVSSMILLKHSWALMELSCWNLSSEQGEKQDSTTTTTTTNDMMMMMMPEWMFVVDTSSQLQDLYNYFGNYLQNTNDIDTCQGHVYHLESPWQCLEEDSYHNHYTSSSTTTTTKEKCQGYCIQLNEMTNQCLIGLVDFDDNNNNNNNNNNKDKDGIVTGSIQKSSSVSSFSSSSSSMTSLLLLLFVNLGTIMMV